MASSIEKSRILVAPFKMSQKYSRAKVFPSCEECVADHFRGLHELIDANGYLEWDFVRSSVAGEIDI